MASGTKGNVFAALTDIENTEKIYLDNGVYKLSLIHIYGLHGSFGGSRDPYHFKYAFSPRHYHGEKSPYRNADLNKCCFCELCGC